MYFKKSGALRGTNSAFAEKECLSPTFRFSWTLYFISLEVLPWFNAGSASRRCEDSTLLRMSGRAIGGAAIWVFALE
jgi:hypothetical protein